MAVNTPVEVGLDWRVTLVDPAAVPVGTPTNPLTIAIAAGGTGSAVSAVDEAAFTAGVSAFDPSGGVFNDSVANLTSGQSGEVRLTAARAFQVNLRDATGVQFGTVGNPIFTTATGGGSAVTGTKTSNTVVPGATNLGVLPAVANAAAPTYTETFQVLLSTDLSGNLRVIPSGTTTVGGTVTANAGTGTFTTAGALTNNNAAPGATNIGSLTALANAVAPTWTEGDQVLLSVDLKGNQRSIVQGQQAAGAAITDNPVLIAGQSGGNVKLLALDTSGFPTVNQGGPGSGGASAWFTQGPDAAGTAIVGRPFLQGISDGTNAQIAKQITASTGTTGVGLPGVGPALWDLIGGVNFVKQAGDASGRAMVVGHKTSNAAVPGATNLGVLPAVANAAAPTFTETFQTALSVDLAGNLRVIPSGTTTVAGAKTNNNAAPDGGNIGALPAVANAAAPTWTEGDLVFESVDLKGNQRVIPSETSAAFGANPTAVTAGQPTPTYSTRQGIPFFLGGHPNIITVRANYTAAQTNTAVVANSAGTKIIVTGFMIDTDNATTVNVQARIGLAQTVTPTTTGVFGSHPGIAPGSGIARGGGAGIIGVGADGDQVLITTSVPTTGSIDVIVEYFTTPT